MARDQVMTPAEAKMPRFTGWLRPLVDAVARVKAGVHRKLLFGFLIGALLLVAMAMLSLLVIRQMNDRMEALDRAQVKSSRAQEMLYAVTAQSHYRAMGLLLPNDAAKYNGQVEDAKATFAQRLDELEQAEPDNAAFYEDVRTVNEEYRQSGQKVLALMDQGRMTRSDRSPPGRGAPDFAQARGVDADAHRVGAGRHGPRPERLSVCARPVHRHGDRVLGPERDRGPDTRVRPLVGVHPSGPQDGRSARSHHRRQLRPPCRRAEPRRVRRPGARRQPHERALGDTVRRSAVAGDAAGRHQCVARTEQRGEVAFLDERQP